MQFFSSQDHCKHIGSNVTTKGYINFQEESAHDNCIIIEIFHGDSQNKTKNLPTNFGYSNFLFLESILQKQSKNHESIDGMVPQLITGNFKNWAVVSRYGECEKCV